MNILNTWTETWLVKFNPQKTEFVIFSNNKNIDQVNIHFNGENIKQVEYHTHLGVCLSSNCKWRYHINNTCQRATKRIHILRKLKYLLNRTHLSKIYKTYNLPILEYGCELWDDCCIRDTQTLECLQLETARIVTGLLIYSSAESLYFETGWSKLEDRRKSRKLNLFDKIENNMAPTYVSRDGSRISSEGGAHLKKLRRAKGGAQNFGVFRVKNHDFTPTNLIFFQF
jgi:hypothetical protein